MQNLRLTAYAALSALTAAALPSLLPAGSARAADATAALLRPSKKANTTPIQHVVIIVQENRSFDSYFGTYPGANGIPNGHLRAAVTKEPRRRLRGALP